jgi:hypothetical protein
MSSDEERVFVSHLTLRRAVGAMGILLPPIMVIGCWFSGCTDPVQQSISAYYGTDMRDIFVGILFVTGWFLFAYRGYDRRDNLAGDLACVFALGVALFPVTDPPGPIRTLHHVFASALFLTLTYFSLFLFTKTKPGRPLTRGKILRNRVYIGCGVIMLACLVMVPVYCQFFDHLPIAQLKPVFWLEALALWAFGVSWAVKGETILRDVDEGVVR